MGRTFAIGDIHGCAKTAKKLLLDELKITKEDVIDFILQLKNENYNINPLRGNHEQLFMDSDKSFTDFQNWIANGGVATLESFEISRYAELEDVYKNFFNETKFYFETEGFVFVHAGFDFSNPNFLEDTDSMLWIRNMKVDKKKIGNRIIVHGHTPTPLEKVKKNLLSVNEKGSLNIDTGCVLKDYNGLGYLTGLEVGTMKLYEVKNID